MKDKTKQFEKLEKENLKLRDKIHTLLSEYMMSEEVEDARLLINQLIENEIQQEDLCEQ